MNIGTVIKCCPLCGGRIVVSNLYQYSLDYTMRKDGKIGKRHKRGDDGSMDVSLASCENYKTCDARWEAEEFFVEPDGTFHDYKYIEDGHLPIPTLSICATITTKMTCSARRPALRFKASWKSSARLTAASSTLFATARSSDGC